MPHSLGAAQRPYEFSERFKIRSGVGKRAFREGIKKKSKNGPQINELRPGGTL
jgi:hypothetical protein